MADTKILSEWAIKIAKELDVGPGDGPHDVAEREVAIRRASVALALEDAKAAGLKAGLGNAYDIMRVAGISKFNTGMIVIQDELERLGKD